MNQVTLPGLAIKNSVLFPYVVMPLVVSRAKSVAAIEAALASEDKQIVVVTQRDPYIEDPGIADVYKTGTLAVIKKIARINNAIHVEVQGLTRVALDTIGTEGNYLKFSVNYLPDCKDESEETEALYRLVMETVGEMLNLVKPEMKANLSFIMSGVENSLQQIYFLVSFLPLDVEREEELLSATSRLALLKLLYTYLVHEVHVLKLRSQIDSEVQSSLEGERREILLRRQMHAIQKELGEETDEQSDVRELRKSLEDKNLPEPVRQEVEKELKQLERSSSSSPQYQTTRAHIELILELPWNTATSDMLDLDRAQRILDDEHFDLKDVKQRILEHLAVMKLNPQAKAPILCFVGPPGVGKTSVGRSIANAMGRKFERMSLGGLHDEAELRGHRRTYIGAMPGRIIQAIRRVGTKNPVLMLDEVDKLGRDFRGDPAAALMEVLDPVQNVEFRDNYLDMPFDLSGVFFITTANTLDNIPEPLLDRMEILRLSGYSDEEKVQIARRYLIPRRWQEAGITLEQLLVSDDALRRVIRRYTREAGVRDLERVLGSLARKAASRIVKGEGVESAISKIEVRVEDLAGILGPESFRDEQLRSMLQAGVVAGLAWTPAGGDVLYVEAVLLGKGRQLLLTGQLGEVMQESAKIAQSYVWANLDALGIDKDRALHHGVHIHVPAGAVPKDGPSAGVTMVTALVSLYSGLPVRADLAMTGEITLSGLVLPVGGIKEKIIAAHRAGIRHVILPTENEKDLVELSAPVRTEMEFICVHNIHQVLEAAIPSLSHPGLVAV
jgi:ATP-dependent Lon protease